MAFIVEMVHRKEDRLDPQFFSCNGDTWKHLLTLAETFGWQPQGSVNPNDHDLLATDYAQHFKPNYEPEEWAYCKAVSKEDAKNIAEALLIAHDAIKSGKVSMLPKSRTTVFGEDLTECELLSINSNTSQQLLQFGLFASQGGFLFAWDD